MTTPSAVDAALAYADLSATETDAELARRFPNAVNRLAILAAEVRRLRQPVSDAEVSALAFTAVAPDGEAALCIKLCDAIALLRRRTAGADVPEGETPADARALRKGNYELAQESCRLQDALSFYAERQHLRGMEEWDSVSGESQEWLGSPHEVETAMVEDGATARAALAPFAAAPPAAGEKA